MIKKLNIFLNTFPLEVYLWIGSLLALAIIDIESTHYSICLFNNLGFEFCPGCGLGRSIHHLLYLDLLKSFNAHPLGGIAFLILLHRIFFLAKSSIQNFQNNIILLKE